MFICSIEMLYIIVTVAFAYTCTMTKIILNSGSSLQLTPTIIKCNVHSSCGLPEMVGFHAWYFKVLSVISVIQPHFNNQKNVKSIASLEKFCTLGKPKCSVISAATSPCRFSDKFIAIDFC